VLIGALSSFSQFYWIGFECKNTNSKVVIKTNERKKSILKAVVEHYIRSAEPVGSKTIGSDLNLSSATIRNEMSELEEHGMLSSPHTSAGRVPTTAAYRIYVNELMHRYSLTIDETAELNKALREKINELDSLISYTSRIVSKIMNLPAYAATETRTEHTIKRFDLIEVDACSFIIVIMLSDDSVKNRLVRTAFSIPDGLLQRTSAVFNSAFTEIPEKAMSAAKINAAARAVDDTVGIAAITAQFAMEMLTEQHPDAGQITGQTKLLDYPEFRDIKRARALLDYLSGDNIPPALPTPDAGESVSITIGSENLAEELRDSGVVAIRKPLSDGRDLLVGVVGPKRIDYAKIMSRLEYLANGLSDSS